MIDMDIAQKVSDFENTLSKYEYAETHFTGIKLLDGKLFEVAAITVKNTRTGEERLVVRDAVAT